MVVSARRSDRRLNSGTTAGITNRLSIQWEVALQPGAGPKSTAEVLDGPLSLPRWLVCPFHIVNWY